MFPSHPITLADAASLGVSPAILRSDEFTRLFHGVYVHSKVDVTTAVKARAALRVLPRSAVLSHYTAAELLGGWAPSTPDIHVSLPAATRSERAGIVAHRYPQPSPSISVRSLPVTTPARTFVDLAANLDLVALVALGDSLVAKRRTSAAALVHATMNLASNGCGTARAAAPLVRAGVDSAMESRLRMLLVMAGLPEPVINHVLRDVDGTWMIRLDLAYPTLKIAVEYDGRQHAESVEQWHRDIGRREWLDARGWRIIIVTADDIYRTPSQVVTRVRTALTERGWTNSSVGQQHKVAR